MSDPKAGLVVLFDEGLHEDNQKAIARAIGLIVGVMRVHTEGVPDDIIVMMASERAKLELREKTYEVLR